MGASPRAARVALVSVLACLLPLLLHPGPVSAAEGAKPVGTTVVDPTTNRSPGPGADFPRMPARCYDSRDELTSPCRLVSAPGRPILVVWGDSHAQQYLPAIRQLAQKQRVNLVALLFGGCPPSLPFRNTSHYPPVGCDTHNVESLDYVRYLVRKHGAANVHLLIGGFWGGYRKAYAAIQAERNGGPSSGLTPYRKRMAKLAIERTRPMFKRIGDLRVGVDMVAPSAAVPAEPRECARGRMPYQCDLPRSTALYQEWKTKQWMRSTLTSGIRTHVRFIDPSPVYCGRTTCFAHARGTNTFYDDIHLGARLTKTMTGYFRPVIRSTLRR